MLKATEALEREHKAIQKVVAVMAQLIAQLELRHMVQRDILLDLLQFMRVFSEQCHHGKEESYFFPYLERKGVPSTGCPLAALRSEHAKSRQLMGDLNSAVAAYIDNADAGRLTLVQVLHSLVVLYPAHIWKEDYLLFPMADKVLGPGDHEALLRDFHVVEEVIGADAAANFERIADELSTRIDHCPECEVVTR